MTPFYFGDPRRSLYGVYHAPRLSVARSHAVVLCPPIAQEYMRSHVAFVELADHLAQAGVHVLRFDYGGTGDSAGAEELFDVERWVDDLAHASTEARALSGASRVTLVGLRLGATLAARGCARGAVSPDRLVLWDPVVDGRTYLSVLGQLDASAAAERRAPRGASEDLLGFPFPSSLRLQLQRLELTSLIEDIGDVRIVAAVSAAGPDYDRLGRTLADRGHGDSLVHVPDAGDWDAWSRAHDALLAPRILQVVASLASEAA